MNKYSEPLFQKSNFSPPGMTNFSNIFITSPKTFNLSLGVAGKEILTLSALSRSCQFLPLSDRTTMVNHEILLTKLGNYGIHGVAYKWFKSYLENRRPKCFVSGSLSKNLVLSAEFLKEQSLDRSYFWYLSTTYQIVYPILIPECMHMILILYILVMI